MPIYVDDSFIPYKSKRGRIYKMSHMIADTPDELFEFALKLGLKMDWFQPKSFPHFDVTKTVRTKAIKNGAESLTTRELVEKIKILRTKSPYNEKFGNNPKLKS